MGIYPQPFEDIIRRAASGEAVPPAMKIVTFEQGERKKSPLSIFNRPKPIEYFVRENVSKKMATTLAIPYADPEAVPLALKVNYSVSIATGQSQLAAHFVHVSGRTAHDFVKQKLQGSVIAWVNERRKSTDNPLEVMIRNGKNAIEAIAKQVLIEHGFDADVSLQVEEPRLFEEEVAVSDLSVSTKGLPKFKFDTSCVVTLVQSGDHVPSDKTDWEDLIRDRLMHIFPEKIDVSTYFGKSAEVAAIVHAALEQELSRYHVKLLYKPVLQLMPLGYSVVDQQEYDIPWKRSDMPTISFPFRASHQIHDLHQFFESDPVKPVRLIERALETAVRECLFNKERYDLRPDSIQQLAQQQVANYANTLLRSHGIKIDLLVSKLSLYEWRFLKEFPVAIETRRYDTNAIGQPVSFDIAIRARFKTLERVQHLIYTDRRDARLGSDRLETKIQEHATETAQEFLRDVSSTEFYGEFEKYEVNETTGKIESVPALKLKLETLIANALALEFGLTDPLSKVTVRLDQEQYGNYVESFKRNRDDFEFELNIVPTGRVGSASDERKFNVAIGLNGIDFRKLPEMTREKFNRANFEKDVERECERRLEALSLEDLLSVGVAGIRSDREIEIREYISQYCAREYAVNVVVKDIKSLGSRSELESIRQESAYFEIDQKAFDDKIAQIRWKSQQVQGYERERIKMLIKRDLSQISSDKPGGFRNASPRLELERELYGKKGLDHTPERESRSNDQIESEEKDPDNNDTKN